MKDPLIRPDIQGRFALTPDWDKKAFKVQVLFTKYTSDGSKTYQFGVLIPFNTITEIEEATEFVFSRAHRENDDGSQLKVCPECHRKVGD